LTESAPPVDAIDATKLAEAVVAKAASDSGDELPQATPPLKPRKPRRSKVGTSRADVAVDDISEEPTPSKAEIAEQVAVASNEDVPFEAKRKGGVSEELMVEEINNQKANRELRRVYADKAYELASGCIQFWAVAISANGIIFVLLGKQMISDNAMIAITTGVTVNVLAAFLGVIRGLFPSDSPRATSDKKLKKPK
jgi:hypothetical protein